ncbi:MAG: DUF2505 family protein [bacterium]
MRFKLVHYFNVNTETFQRLTSDKNLQEYIDALPNLAGREDLERWEDERYAHARIRVLAVGLIPKEVRHILKPKMLTWIEESVYDKLNHTFEWKIIPYYFRQYVECRGTYKYIDEGNSRMRREIEGMLNISAPVFGRLIEQYIIQHLKKNFDAEYRVTSNYINKKLQQESVMT